MNMLAKTKSKVLDIIEYIEEDSAWWMFIVEVLKLNKAVPFLWGVTNVAGKILLVPVVASIIWMLMIVLWAIATALTIIFSIPAGIILLIIWVTQKSLFKQH